MDLVVDVQVGLPLKAYLFSQCAGSGLAAIAGDFCEPDSFAPIVLFHFDSPSEQVLLRLFISDKPHQRAIRSLEWSPPGVERMLLVGVEDGRVFVYSMTDASRDSSVSLNCCVFNEWYGHQVVAPFTPAPLATAAWLSPPKQLHWPSALTRHRFGPEAPCGLEQAFAWTEQNGAEPYNDLDRLPFGVHEWVRPHTAVFAVVTQDSHLTVYWQALTGPGAQMAWHASARINLGNMRVPAALAHVATSPGGKVHVAVVLHDYPGEHDALEEHVVSTYTQGDLTCTSPDTQPDASGGPPGVAMPRPPLDSRIYDGSPVRAAFLRCDELCHRLLLFTQQRERPWQWALRCFSPSGGSARGNAVLHSFDIDYAAFGAPFPESLLRQGAAGDADDSIILDVAVSPDVALAAVLVVIDKHASVVWVDLRNQVPSAAGGALETCQVLGIWQLPWMPVWRECVRVQFSPNGALLMLLVSHLELTSAMGLVTRRTALYGTRIPAACRAATAAVAIVGVPPQFEPLFVYKPQQEHALVEAVREGVLSAFQLAWAILTEHAPWDIVWFHKWHCCACGDGTPLQACLLVANDMLHSTTSEVCQGASAALDSFKAVALPLLLQPNCSKPAAALVECLAVDVRARRLCTLVVTRLDQLGTPKMVNSLATALSSKGHLTPGEATILKEKVAKQAPWVRWAELFLMALLMSLKQWMTTEGREASYLPLMRLLVDEHFTVKILPYLFEASKSRHRSVKVPAPNPPQAQPWPTALSDVQPDSHVAARQFPHVVQVLERLFDRKTAPPRSAAASGSLGTSEEALSVALLESVFPSHGLAHFCIPNTKSVLITKFSTSRAAALEQIEKACKSTLPGVGSWAQMRENMALLGISPFQALCEPPGRQGRAAALANLKKAPAWSMDLPGWRALNPRTARPDALMHEFYDVDEQVAMGMFTDTTRQRGLAGADAITGVLPDCPSPVASEYTNSGVHGKRGMLDVEALDGSCATNELTRSREEFAAAPQTVTQAVLRSSLASSPLTGAPWKRCRRY